MVRPFCLPFKVGNLYISLLWCHICPRSIATNLFHQDSKTPWDFHEPKDLPIPNYLAALLNKPLWEGRATNVLIPNCLRLMLELGTKKKTL